MAKSTIITKTFRCIVKSADPATGIIDMLIPLSTPSEDRTYGANGGEVIAAGAFDKWLPQFRKRAVLVADHNYSDIRKQIGEFTEIVSVPEGLFGKPKYYINQGNDEADWAFNIASKGMAAYSVSFIPYDFIRGKAATDPVIKYTNCEPIEISHVVVPMNRDTIQAQRGKSFNPVIDKLLDDVLASDVIKGEHKEKDISQAEIKDELDYCTRIVKSGNLNAENKTLLDEICRLAGYDNPVHIKGAKVRIQHAMDACKTAMDTMAAHDKCHQQAFAVHSESIIKCYNGLKGMLDKENATPPDMPEEAMAEDVKPVNVTQQSINVDEIIAKTVEKY